MRLMALCLVAVCAAANAAAQQPVEWEVITDYVAPPDTLRGLAKTADALVRVTVNRSRTSGAELEHPSPRTEHECVILETLKSSEFLPVTGAVVTVVEPAGVIEAGSRRMRSSEPIHLTPGGEYVVFLVWNRYFRVFELAFGPSGAYRVDGSTVEAFSETHVSAAQRGRPVEQFLRELKEWVQPPR